MTTQAPVQPASDTPLAERLMIPCALFLVAAALRFAYLAEVSVGPFFELGGVDSRTYVLRAQTLGTTWPGGFAFDQPPFYPIWLAAIGRVFGESIWTLKSAQALIGSLSCVLVYFIGRRVFPDPRIATLAAVFCCFNGTLIYFDGQIVSANLETFLACSAILALLAASDRDRAIWWLLAGTAIGLSAINRGAILVTLPFVVFWLFRKDQWGEDAAEQDFARVLRSGLRRTLLVCFPVGLCILPVTVHNFNNDVSPSLPPAVKNAAEQEPRRGDVIERLMNRDFVLLTSRIGMNLYLGNDPVHYDTNDPNHEDCFSHINHVVKLPYREYGERSASGQQAVLVDLTKRTIAEDPAAWISLVGYKVLQLMNGLEIPRNANLYAERELSNVLWALLWPAPLAFPGGLLIPLGLLGLGLDRRTWRDRFLLFSFLLPRTVFVLAFFIAARLRVPMIPIVTLFAAFALVWLFDRVRAKQWRPLAPALASVIVLFVLANLRLSTPVEHFGAYEHMDLANHLSRKGEHEEALVHYRKAAGISPDDVTVRFMWAAGLDRARQADDAIELLEEVLRLDPSVSEAAVRIGNIHQRAGRYGEALEALDRALEIHPRNQALQAQRDRVAALHRSAAQKSTSPEARSQGEASPTPGTGSRIQPEE